jgi:hypothetical protein
VAEVSNMVWQRNVVAAGVASIVAVVTDVAYLMLIGAQDATPPHPAVEPFLLVYIAAIAIAGAASAALILRDHRESAKTMLVAAAAGSAVLGIVAIFSIGLGLVITAGLLWMAASGVAPTAARMPRVVAALGAVGILIAGFTVTGVFWGS